MSARSSYIVGTGENTHLERIDLCRAALNAIASDAATFECDLPLSMTGEWPATVLTAAKHLQSLGSERQREPLYARTGVLATSTTTWTAFITFAPWSYDGTVWEADGAEVASFSDLGYIWVCLSESQRQALETVVGPENLSTAEDWAALRKAQRDRWRTHLNTRLSSCLRRLAHRA